MHSPLLLCALAAAALQGHPEILVGCDSEGQLVVVHSSEPYPLAASRFTGIDGHADGFPGISTLFEVQEGRGLRPPELATPLVFELVGASEGMHVWNDQGTALMRAGERYQLGVPAFDTHPVWNILGGSRSEPYALRLKVIDPSGKYAESAVAELAFRTDDLTLRHICPMRCGEGRVFDEAGLCPECGMRLKAIQAASYAVEIEQLADDGSATQLQAGRESTLVFHLRTPLGEVVPDLEVVHEKLLHLLLVSEDLAWFAHEHPVLQADGSFRLRFAFPNGGRYTLYNDFTPTSAGMQVVPVELVVAGAARAPAPPVGPSPRGLELAGYTIELQAKDPLASIQTQSLGLRISRAGKPVTDLEPYLGAMGHLIVIDSERKHFVHSHPLPPASPDAPGAHGPEVVFRAQFPAPGLYKAWAQFQHEGQVLTAPFVFRVVTPSEALQQNRR